jgi:hypothetical protein
MMKTCRYCGNSYPESDFGVAKTTDNKVYRRQKCRYCYRKTKNILRTKRIDVVNEIKEKNGCMRCGIKDPRVLEFHHLNTDSKEFNIADYYYSHYSFERLEVEIAKCAVICANCHRILHAEERGKQ